MHWPASARRHSLMICGAYLMEGCPAFSGERGLVVEGAQQAGDDAHVGRSFWRP